MQFDQMIEKFMEAIRQKDLGQVLSLISVDENICEILLNGMAIKGRSAFLNLQAAWFSDPDWQLDYKILRTIETPEMAYALLLIDYRDPKMGDEDYEKQHYVSLAFTKKDDKWVLFHDQTTVVK